MTQKDAITQELEAALVYSCIVAGKSAKFTDAVMRKLAADLLPGESFFDMFARLRAKYELLWTLKKCRTGNYEKLWACFVDLLELKLDLSTCTPEDLEEVHGIGPKTSRFFILWTRDGANHAALDVHVLRWLRTYGWPDAPHSTPPRGAVYDKWQVIVLAVAEEIGFTARQLDRLIWMDGSGYQVLS